MSSLRNFLEIQRQENEVLKGEIEMQLDNLFNPLDEALQMLDNNPTRFSNFLTQLCQFEQRMNHKLVEINYDLKKFSIQNKFPENHSPTVKTPLENELDDIATLKANSSELIIKLEKLQDENVNEAQYKVFWNTSPYGERKVCVKKEIPIELSNSLLDFDSSPVADKTCDKLDFIENCEDSIKCDIKLENDVESENKYSDINELEDKGIVEDEYSINEDDFLGGEYSSDHEKSSEQLNENVNCEDSTKSDIKLECEVESEKEFSDINELEEKGIMEDEIIESSFSADDFLGSECDSDHEKSNFDEHINENGGKVDWLLNNSSNHEQMNEYLSEEYESQPNETDISISDEDTKISNPESQLSQFMWKNIIELGNTTPKDMSITENCDSLPPEDVNVILEDENVFDENKLDSELAFTKIPMNDSEFCDIDSSSEVVPESSSTEYEEIGRSELENSCDNKEKLASECSTVVELSGQIKIPENGNLELSSNNDEGISDSSNDTNSISTNTESSKTVYSAEEKIKKLGLEDRMTLFERTRKMAVLPDLCLKPVAREEKYNKNQEYGIATSIQPTEGMICVFSHVESPAEFYMHPNTEEAMLIDSLNDLITQHYMETKSPYDSKIEASQDIDRFCCVHLKDLKMYYRAEIVDWLIGEHERHLMVQLVDYGNYQFVHYKSLRPLDYMFTLLPKLAIKCYFPLLYPPGSTKTNLLVKWPRTSVEALFDLSGLGLKKNNAFFRLAHVENENNEFAVDMTLMDESYSNTIGQLLVDLGHAVQVILPEDDPMGVLSDEEDIKNLERCDNLNEVILGYDPKDEARICKFTKKGGGRCFKRNCKLEHVELNKGGFTTDKTLTYCEPLNDLRLPKVGEITCARFTTFIDANRFYITLRTHLEELRRLEVIMNDQSNCSKFETFKVLPARGEIVIVHHWQKRWLRAKIRHHLFNEQGKCTGAQVFMVDYGDTIDARLENIRKMKKDYLNLPFQAIECRLSGYRESPSYDRKEMEIFFYKNMVFRFFTAKVVASSDMQLNLEFYYKQRLLGDILDEYGFLKKANQKNIYPHPKSTLIPG